MGLLVVTMTMSLKTMMLMMKMRGAMTKILTLLPLLVLLMQLYLTGLNT